MRNLLALLALLALTFLGLGWYLDWYRIESTPTSPGRTAIQIDIDKKKIGEDVARGLRKGEERLQGFLDSEEADQTGSTAKQDEQTTGSSGSVWPLRLFKEPTKDGSR